MEAHLPAARQASLFQHLRFQGWVLHFCTPAPGKDKGPDQEPVNHGGLITAFRSHVFTISLRLPPLSPMHGEAALLT